MTPLVTFYTNSFNRLPLLKNLLKSFEVCNMYPAVEWVITDYGSTDGSRQWLSQYAKQASFPVKVLLGDEQDYFAQLQLPELDRRTRFEAILRKYRNDAIAAAQGELVFDVATDHQFIRRGDWVHEIFEVFRHREQVAGRDDLSGVIAFGYFRWRLDKPNNKTGSEQGGKIAAYYVAQGKPYVDYMVMKRSRLAELGPYFELTAIQRGSNEARRWQERDDSLRPETEYAARCKALDLKRAFLKYPILASFKNDELADKMKSLREDDDDLIIPISDSAALMSKFRRLRRPVSSEEIQGRNMRMHDFFRTLSIMAPWR